jgi:hypothetical protein
MNKFTITSGWMNNGNFIRPINTADGHATRFAVVMSAGAALHSGFLATAKLDVAEWDGETEGRFIKRIIH